MKTKSPFTKEQETQLDEIDFKRKSYNYLMGELSDLRYWLENGYKEGEGRNRAIELITAEIENLKQGSQNSLDLIFAKRKEWGIDK